MQNPVLLHREDDKKIVSSLINQIINNANNDNTAFVYHSIMDLMFYGNIMMQVEKKWIKFWHGCKSAKSTHLINEPSLKENQFFKLNLHK